MIIGITGGSGSGKTTVIKRLKDIIPEKSVATLHMDSYYRDNSHLPPAERIHLNFDHPNAIDFNLLNQHVQSLRNGQAIRQPVYNFTTSCREKETTVVNPAPVIMVEGILIFCDKKLLDLFDLKIFVDAGADERLLRIIERDTRERGQTLQSVIERYAVVKEMHHAFVEPGKQLANIIIPMSSNNQVAIDVLADIIYRKAL